MFTNRQAISKLALEANISKRVKKTEQMEPKRQKRILKQCSRDSPTVPLTEAATSVTATTPPMAPPEQHLSVRNASSLTLLHSEVPAGPLLEITPLLPFNAVNDDIVLRYIANRKRVFKKDIETHERELENLQKKQASDVNELEKLTERFQSIQEDIKLLEKQCQETEEDIEQRKSSLKGDSL